MRAFWLTISFLLFGSIALAQSSLRIDKLEKKDLDQAGTEVGFSTVVEGTVNDPTLAVYVLVYQPHLKGWRLFPAAIRDEGGSHRWRTLCRFGEFDGTGLGGSYQVRAVAFSKDQIARGLPKKLPSDVLKSNTVVLKRTK